MAFDSRPVLHVCITCRHSAETAEPIAESPAGAALHETVVDRLRARNLEEEVRVNPVSCMANCEQGCSAAVSSPGKWTYLAGYLSAEISDDLIDYVLVYGASKTGVVMPSRRAPSLRNAIVARVPAHPNDLTEQGEPA